MCIHGNKLLFNHVFNHVYRILKHKNHQSFYDFDLDFTEVILEFSVLGKHIAIEFFHNSRLIRLIEQEKRYQTIWRVGLELNPDHLLSS